MAREGGVEKLTPEQLDKAQRAYDNWQFQSRYSFQDYVSYVQEKHHSRESSIDPEQIKSRFKERDLVVINQHGEVYALTQRNTGDDYATRKEFLKDIDRAPLSSVIDTWAVLKDVHQHRREETLWAEREKHWPLNPPEPHLTDTLPRHLFEDAAQATTRSPAQSSRTSEGRGCGDMDGLPSEPHRCRFPAAALGENRIQLAAVTKEEADRSYREAAFTRELAAFPPPTAKGKLLLSPRMGAFTRSINTRPATVEPTPTGFWQNLTARNYKALRLQAGAPRPRRGPGYRAASLPRSQ